MADYDDPPRRSLAHLVMLGFGIYVMPYVFAWLTLRPGYPRWYRITSFAYAIVLVVLVILYILTVHRAAAPA